MTREQWLTAIEDRIENLLDQLSADAAVDDRAGLRDGMTDYNKGFFLGRGSGILHARNAIMSAMGDVVRCANEIQPA